MVQVLFLCCYIWLLGVPTQKREPRLSVHRMQVRSILVNLT